MDVVWRTEDWSSFYLPEELNQQQKNDTSVGMTFLYTDSRWGRSAEQHFVQPLCGFKGFKSYSDYGNTVGQEHPAIPNPE